MTTTVESENFGDDATILSIDVVGYSRLMTDDGPETVKALEGRRDLVTQLVTQEGGQVFGFVGDGMMAVFADDVSAARAAIDIQASVGRLNGSMPAQRRMALRVGINRGEIIQQGDTFYGDGVNLAARVMTLANAGQICLSERVFERIEDQIECGYAYLGKQAYKNIEGKVPTYRMRLAPEAVGTITTERVHRARNYRWQFLAALLLLAVASALGG